jgi:hypothetical protein
MPKQSPTRRNMFRIYNKTAARWHSYAIDFTVGWSFGEQQRLGIAADVLSGNWLKFGPRA